MPKRRRRATVPTQVWHQERSGVGSRVLGRSPQFYATIGVVALVAVALGLIVYAFGSNWLEDRNRPGSTAIQVGETKYSVRYFSERLRQFVDQVGGAQSQIAQTPQIAIATIANEIEEEAIVLVHAPEQGVAVDDNEIRAEIATILSLSGPDDPNFDNRFQEEVNNTDISESQYRDRATSAVLRRKLNEKFTAEVPATAESVHYREIVLGSQADADAALAEVQGGADFAQVATEKSQDAGGGDGGDVGWAPRGSLDKALEDKLFGLEVGGLTTYEDAGGQFFVYQVVEKQADRPVEDAQKTAIADKSYERWIEEKRSALTIENTVTPGDCDSKKVKWALDRALPNPNNDLFSESFCG